MGITRENPDFEIISHICDLNTNIYGMTKEVNIVSWNGEVAKYDIRHWNAEHDRMTRGMTLTKEEMQMLVDAMNRHYGKE